MTKFSFVILIGILSVAVNWLSLLIGVDYACDRFVARSAFGSGGRRLLKLTLYGRAWLGLAGQAQNHTEANQRECFVD